MARIMGIGHQDFGQLIQSGCFYIDKTGFIKEWWENNAAALEAKRIPAEHIRKYGFAFCGKAVLIG